MENTTDKSSLTDKLRQVGNTKNMECPYCLINAHFIFFAPRKISSLEIRESKCPSCMGVIVETRESSKELKPQPLGGQKLETMFSSWEIIYPRVKLICTDEKIPTEIRNDLNNANSIIDITGDAAASLARRALERTLRKYLGLKEYRLEDLIIASEKLLHPRIFKLLDAVRGFGNFGAHLKEDSNTADLLLVEKDQALCMIQVVRELVQDLFVHQMKNDVMLEQLKKMKERAKK